MLLILYKSFIRAGPIYMVLCWEVPHHNLKWSSKMVLKLILALRIELCICGWSGMWQPYKSATTFSFDNEETASYCQSAKMDLHRLT